MDKHPSAPPGLIGALAISGDATRAGAEIDALPAADVVILLAAGDRGVHDSAVVHGGDVPVELPIAADVLPAVTRLLQYPLVRGEGLPQVLADLAMVVLWTRGHAAVVPVTVPAGMDRDVAGVVGSSLHEALIESEASGVLVAAVAPGATTTAAFRAACEAAELDITELDEPEGEAGVLLVAIATTATGTARRFDRAEGGARREGVLPRSGDPRG